MIKNKIKVLIVDDSDIFIKLIEDVLAEKDIEVIGVARDAFQAWDKIVKLKPDVVTLDVEMPKMSGIDFLRFLLPRFPIPVVMVSSVSSSVFDAINAGAVDFVAKPSGLDKENIGAFSAELITKIKIASIAKLENIIPIKKSNDVSDRLTKKNNVKVIAIGASTGGTEAISQILCSFEEEVPGIVVVQHMPPVFTGLYAKRLNSICSLKVKEAEDGDLVLPGRALIAPGGMHMKLVKKDEGFIVRCYEGEKVNGHSPSVDVLFKTVAKEVGNNAIGVLLTGMGKDGAEGLFEMKKSGAYTIAQDEKTCVVFGMSKEAINMGGASSVLPLDKIAEDILNNIK